MDRLSHWILKYRLLILAASAAITLWLGSYIPRIQFDTSSDGTVPRGDESQAFYEETINTFGNDVVSVAVVVAPGPDGVFTPATLAKIDRLSRAIESIPGVHEVVSLTNATYLSGAGGFLRTLPVVPEIPSDRQAVLRLRDFVLGNRLFHKTLVSVDGRAAAINIFLDSLPDAELVKLDVDGKVRALLAGAGGPEQLYYAGLTNTRRIINATMHRDLRVLVPLSLLLIAVILLLTFRSASGVLLPLLTVAMATIWTMGLIGLTGHPISLVTTMLPPFLIAIGNAYAIHLVSEHRAELARGRTSKEAAHRSIVLLAGPVALTAFTTMIGFASLYPSPIPNIRTMGVFATAGTLFAGLIAMIVVPAILSYVGRGKRMGTSESPNPRLHTLLHSLGRLASRRAGWVVILTALLTGGALWATLRLKVDTDFLSYFKRTSEIRITADLIAENLAGASAFYLIVDGHDPESMKRPEVLHAIDDIQRYMEHLPGIDKTASIVDHLKLLHKSLNDDDPAFERIPETRGIIEEELLLFIISRDPAALARYVNGDFSQISVFVRSRLVGSHEIRETLRRIEDYAAARLPAGVDARPTGTIIVLSNALEAIARGQATSLGSALLMIFVVIAVFLRSLKAGALAMVPNAVPIALVFGIMGLTGITLNIGTSIIASTALGIAVDDTIHVLTRFKRGIQGGLERNQAILETLTEGGKAMVLASVALCFGFLILAVSDFAIIRAVGVLTAITMISALAVEVFITPALLALVPMFRGPQPAPEPADEGTG